MSVLRFERPFYPAAVGLMANHPSYSEKVLVSDGLLIIYTGMKLYTALILKSTDQVDGKTVNWFAKPGLVASWISMVDHVSVSAVSIPFLQVLRDNASCFNTYNRGLRDNGVKLCYHKDSAKVPWYSTSPRCTKRARRGREAESGHCFDECGGSQGSVRAIVFRCKGIFSAINRP